MYCLGLDLGSSSVKASVFDAHSGDCLGTASCPEKEMEIIALQSGWAEQDPEAWWDNTMLSIRKALTEGNIPGKNIKAIGIAYQMHGLVCVDKDDRVIRPAIIWCDSRAVDTGNELFSKAGREKCVTHLLNSPGNFTLSKLAWLKYNEPDTFNRIHKIMLPGDYIAMRMTGEISTTITGLSEGILWDYKENQLASFLLDAAGINPAIIADTVPAFGNQGYLTREAAQALDLPAGIPIAYRAGDQPNNAFSLNVLNPGETAANAGTSGVVYGVTDRLRSDPLSRVNTFVHVNHSNKEKRLGVLLCINGAGIANRWIRKITESGGFEQMNREAASIPAGSDGLIFLPFGNGSERMLENRDPGSSFRNINFSMHSRQHFLRAVQEGVAFAFHYGMKILEGTGMETKVIRAGHANMFLSEVFCKTLATLTGVSIELYNTDGSLGAARGAAIGAGYYKSPKGAFIKLRCLKSFGPDPAINDQVMKAYANWESILFK